MLQSFVIANEKVASAISMLDLDAIKVKLMDPEEGKGWTREYTDMVEVKYRRFLFLSVTNQTPIVPTKEVDAFWHQHILDTRKYAKDCERAFGFFLHHFPYFGMRGAEDARNLSLAFSETCRIYEEVFDESYCIESTQTVKCNSCGAASCSSTDCVDSKCGGDDDTTGTDDADGDSDDGEKRTKNIMKINLRPVLT